MDVNERRARFVYEVCRLHAKYLDCPIKPSSWDERDPKFKQQFIETISKLCSGEISFPDPETAHKSWMKKYLEMGWKYGKEYDPEKKIHPDLVPYEKLHPKEKVKDKVFLIAVEIARNFIW